MEQPQSFLEVRVHDLHLNPSLCGLCAGYERKSWRVNQFAAHLVEWLPEFALTESELNNLNSANAVSLLRRAAQIVYQSDKFKNRGEFGELLLHAAVRQVHNSIPAISKIYYKSAVNETVKGFDAVHVVDSEDGLELWLGEAKFYDDCTRAIRDVIAELKDHLETNYLKNEFLVIGGKIDESSKHASELRRLCHPNTSLDEVFSRACIPVLLTYDSNCVNTHEACDKSYCTSFIKELKTHHNNFLRKIQKLDLPDELRVHLFLVPIASKAELVEKLDEKLKTWQQI